MFALPGLVTVDACTGWPATRRYLPGDDRLATLEASLEYQHMAPTAPDTLGCYPLVQRPNDPFVVRECPHIYFAGNQPRFESTLVEGPGGPVSYTHLTLPTKA